jgi:hypothetical protein
LVEILSWGFGRGLRGGGTTAALYGAFVGGVDYFHVGDLAGGREIGGVLMGGGE